MLSAGIICYMIGADGPLIVLGREQQSKGWAGSLRWSDFGGHAAAVDERCPARTAAREFHEESLGVLGDMRPVIEGDRYHFHIVVRTRRDGVERVKYYYVVRIPHDATVAQRFHGRREHLKQILFVVARIRDVQRQLHRQRLPVPDYYYRFAERNEMVRAAPSIEQRSDGSLWANVTTLHRSVAVAHAHRVSPAQAAQYAQLITLKSELDRLIAAFPAELLRDAVVRKLRAGHPSWLPFVRREFLEKDRIGLFSLADLRQGVALRANFAMPLNLAIQQLRYAQHLHNSSRPTRSAETPSQSPARSPEGAG